MTTAAEVFEKWVQERPSKRYPGAKEAFLAAWKARGERGAKTAERVVGECSHHDFHISTRKRCEHHEHDEEGSCLLACVACIATAIAQED